MSCPHKPPCPPETPTWNCGQRTIIEKAMFRLQMDRQTGEHLLRLYRVPIKPMSATERYNREVQAREQRAASPQDSLF